MPTYTVTTTADTGAGSLRTALTSAQSNSGSTILFQGGLSGTISLGSALPTLTDTVTIDGTGATITINGGGTYPVFVFGGSSNTVSISNLTIENGHNNGGGGIYSGSSSTTLLVSNCTFTSNLSTSSGGAMYSGGPLTLTNCVINGNVSSNPSTGTGAGVALGGNATITNCTFTNNGGSGFGGGLWANSGTVSISNCTFATNTSVEGSAVYNGGTANTTITNCTFYGNGDSGLIYGTVFNSGTILLLNSTLSGNTGNPTGGCGGLYNTGTATVTNSILYGDTGSSLLKEINNNTGSITITYSDIGLSSGVYTGTGNINSNPLLGSLASNGGATQTMALGSGSPCYYVGTSTGAPSLDQRGVIRTSPPSMGSYDTNIAHGSSSITGVGQVAAIGNDIIFESGSVPFIGVGKVTVQSAANSTPVSMIGADTISISAATEIFNVGVIPLTGVTNVSATGITYAYGVANFVGDASMSSSAITKIFNPNALNMIGDSVGTASGALSLSSAAIIGVSTLTVAPQTLIFGLSNVIGDALVSATGITRIRSGAINMIGVSSLTVNTTPTPMFNSASTSTDGKSIDVIFVDSASPLLHPASPTSVPGFIVSINGKHHNASALQKGVSGVDGRTFVITLPSWVQVYTTDTVTLGYYPQNPTINSGGLPPVGVPFFVNKPVTNSSNVIPPQLFDPINWLSGTNNPPELFSMMSISELLLPTPPGADLFEWRVGYPMATVQISTSAPTGYIILNENATAGGIEIHHWAAHTASGIVPLTEYYDVLADDLDNTVRQATNFGQATAEGNFESIGYGNSRSLVKYFVPTIIEDVATYPLITMIEIGATAIASKKYALEFKSSPEDTWHTALVMIADTRTRTYYDFTLSAPTSVFAVRMRYLGDFYAGSNTGTLTVTAFDSNQSISAIQVSRYPDFRDATDFSRADQDTGWVNFSQGTSVYNWELENVKRVWQVQSGSASAAFTKLVPMPSVLVGFTSDNHIYTIDTSGNVVLASGAIPGGTHMTSAVVNQSNLYVGLSNGSIIKSSNGSSYISTGITLTDPINSSITPATAMMSYRNQLWIGTSAATSAGNAYLYYWNGTTLTTVRKFNEPYITAMTVQGAYLYIGLGGGVGSGVGKVWMYDGSTWQLTHTPSVVSDRCEVIQYSTEDQALWAAYQGGYIYSAALSGSGQVTIEGWTVRYSSAATNFYDLVDDPNGVFMWMPSDISNQSIDYLYLPSGSPEHTIGTFTSAQCPQPQLPGLTAQFYNSDSVHFNTPTSGTLINTITDGPINWIDFTTTRPSGVHATYWNARWTGYIMSDITETYNFYLNADSNCDLYINHNLVINGLNDGFPGTERHASATLIAEQWTPIQIDYTRGNDMTAYLIFQWASASITKSLVPARNLTSNPNPIAIKDIALFNGNWYGACADGNVYVLDTTAIVTESRRVFIKYQDSSGNITDTTIFTTPSNFDPNGEPIALLGNQIGVLYDNIIQGIQVVNGVAQSSPSIHQIGLTGSPPTPSVITTFEPETSSNTLFAPSRTLRSVGVFESDPYYVATLTSWSDLTILLSLPAGTPVPSQGLDYGTSVQVYVRSAATRNECLAANWTILPTPELSSINNPSGAIPTAASIAYNIQNLSGTWLQYQLVLTTATEGVSPVINMVNVSYNAANASYFFTNVFNTSDLPNQSANPPLMTRGLLTANYVPNGGIITFGYTTDETIGNRFDFNNHYTPITPNTVFTIENSSGVATPSQNIRFGVLFVSLGDGIDSNPPPAIVYDIGVMLDAGTADLQWMAGA